MKDLMINSNANKTFSDIPPFMIKTNDKMSAQAAEVLRTDRNQRFPGSKILEQKNCPLMFYALV